jgi:DNA helicase-2/ATP-dependent DNA helicase PcrA
VVIDAPPPGRAMRRTSAREPASLDQLPVWSATPAADEPVDVEQPGLAALLGGLSAEQRRAVTHGDGPLLVVAGAGTGKTQVITRRIAWLIATKRAKPSEILALTFTDKAAEEMAIRVDQLVPYGYTDTAIATFHAFGDRIVREFALELGLPTDARVLSRPETVIFLREHLFEFGLDEYRPLGDPTRFLSALATLFSRAKDEDVSPAAYAAHAERLIAQAEAAEAVAAAEAAATDADRDAGRPGARPSSRWHSSATRDSSDHAASSTSATRSRLPCASSESRRPHDVSSRPAIGTSSSTSSRTRTGPRRSSSRSWRSRIGT